MSEAVSKSDDLGDEELFVIVEPRKTFPLSRTGRYAMVPYDQRRENWGVTLGFSYGRFLEGYGPKYGNIKDFEDESLVEFHINVKRNLDQGSLGIAFGVSSYNGSSAESESNHSTLSLTPLRLGIQYTIDHIFDEPLIAPYLSGGVYTVFYKESHRPVDGGDGNTEGRTDFSFYATAGFLIQLNWLDMKSTIEAYQESDIKNTFLFVEARSLLKPSKAPDLSGQQANIGMKIEF